jgi:hypothetical protein
MSEALTQQVKELEAQNAQLAARNGALEMALQAALARIAELEERMLSVVATLRQQGRDVLEYLTEACRRARLGQPAPSLLPACTH